MSTAHVKVSDKDGHVVDLVSKSYSSGGHQTVTIAANAGQGPDVACKFCRLQSRSGNGVIRVKIGSACIVTTGVGLPSYPTLTPYPVANLNQLYFYGATDGNVVDIEYFV